MRYTRRLISFVILTMLVGLGFLAISSDEVRAQGGDICIVEIQKVTLPADDTEFNFSVTGGNIFDFTLMDSGPKQPIFIDSANADTTVTEEVPPGWILDNIVCTEPGGVCGGPCLIITEVPNGLTFRCLGETGLAGLVNCTFFNVREAAEVPTLSEWGLIAMAGILGIVGFMVLRRRKVTA